jgi:hypothetical protein
LKVNIHFEFEDKLNVQFNIVKIVNWIKFYEQVKYFRQNEKETCYLVRNDILRVHSETKGYVGCKLFFVF